MGYAVGAFKTIRKEKVSIQTFKKENLYQPKREDETDLMYKVSEIMDDVVFYDDLYLFKLTYYSAVQVQNEETLDRYLQKAKELKGFIQNHCSAFAKNELVKWMIEQVDKGYAIGTDLLTFKGFFAFKEFEIFEKIEYMEEDEIELQHSGSSIPRLFDKIEKNYKVDLRKYMINEDELMYNLNEQEVDNLIQIDNKKAIEQLTSVYERLTDEHDKQVAAECLHIWTEGARLTYDR